MSNEVTINTHEPLREEIPAEEATLGHDRPDMPAPNLWAYGVVVVHRRSKMQAVVHKVDLNTRQFRAFYPSTQEFDPRTGWQSFDDWDVEVTLSPKEVERQAVAAAFEAELAQLDAKDLARILVFCDDPEPAKRMEKLVALREMGMIKPAAAVVAPEPKKDVKR